MKHAEILRDQFLVVQDIAGRPAEHAASGVKDHRLTATSGAGFDNGVAVVRLFSLPCGCRRAGGIAEFVDATHRIGVAGADRRHQRFLVLDVAFGGLGTLQTGYRLLFLWVGDLSDGCRK